MNFYKYTKEAIPADNISKDQHRHCCIQHGYVRNFVFVGGTFVEREVVVTNVPILSQFRCSAVFFKDSKRNFNSNKTNIF